MSHKEVYIIFVILKHFKYLKQGKITSLEFNFNVIHLYVSKYMMCLLLINTAL